MTVKRPPVLSVTQLNTYARTILEQDPVLKNVFVAGEISNFKNHIKTGHFYMTLKDENAAIKAVMFRSYASRLRFVPEDGMNVLCRGRVSVFDRDGAYQLYIEDMQPDGAGSLSVAFEQLKKKLSEQGLFDEKFKKPIPKYPSKIAVITSPTGAALQDILNILSRRWPLCEVVVVPSSVQGRSAQGELVRAVKKADSLCADTVIIGRGGGSVEDLWAFNGEELARAIFECKTPVISAVGHETDFTICDFVSDLRAPTPSAAAELAAPDAVMTEGLIRGYGLRLKDGLTGSVNAMEKNLERLKNLPFLRYPDRIFETREMYLDGLCDRMTAAQKLKLSEKSGKYDILKEKLLAFSPLSVLSRGYAIPLSGGKPVKSTKQLEIGQKLCLRLYDGEAKCTVESLKGR